MAVIKAVPVLACLIIPAMLLPLEEMLIPVRYPEITVDQSKSQVMAVAAQVLTSQQQARLQSLLAQPDTQVMQGVAFYPRAYQTESSASGILRYVGQTTYPVLAYLFEGSGQYWVQHPLENIDQVSLPHGTRVIVVGKFVEGGTGGKSLRAFLTLRQDTQVLLLSSDFSAP